MQPNSKASIAQTVRYLTSAFARAQRSLGNDNRAGTPLYQAQVDFMYLLDEIQRGPIYLTPKAVASANELIDSLHTNSAG